MKIRITLLIILAFATAMPALGADDFESGLEMFNRGDWAVAAELLARSAPQNLDESAARLTAGVALANLKRYSDALEQFKAAAMLSPDGVLPQLLLEGTYEEMGNHEAVRQAHDKADSIIRSGRAFGLPGSSDYGLEMTLARYTRNAIARCLLGDVYQMQQKSTQASEQYAKASQLAPRWAKPFFNLGLANLKTDAREAARNFEQAVRLDPSNLRAHLWLGDAYLEQAMFDRARQEYQTAAQDRTLAVEVQTRLGNLDLRQGDYGAASEQFARAASQAPADPRPIAGQAQALQNSGRLGDAERKYDEAARMLASNASPAPSQSMVRGQMANVQAQQGKMDEAVESLRLAFELHPTPANADALTAAQDRSGTLVDGIRQYEIAMATKLNNQTALIYLFSAYEVQRNWPRMVEIGERLTKANPDQPTNWLRLGTAYERSNRLDLARAIYARVASGPDPAAASAARERLEALGR